MPELRVDPLTGDELLSAPGRGARPHDVRGATPEHCPFCPGNEAETPPARAQFGDGKEWRVRAFRNKYAAVEPPHGVHEVIVDAPTHGAEMTPESLRMYRDRFALHAGQAEMPARYVCLFKNAGVLAGASRRHPHAQLIALDTVPQRPARMKARRDAHFARHGTCALCDEVQSLDPAFEVASSATFVAYVRPLSRLGDTYYLVPREHQPSFELAGDDDLTDLYGLLRRVIDGLETIHRDLSYNLVFESELMRTLQTAAAAHWYLTVILRVSALAGFEIGSGVTINADDAKESARRLRHLVSSHDP